MYVFIISPMNRTKVMSRESPFLGLSSVLNKISQKICFSTAGHLKPARILECCELCPPSAIEKVN